jgi:hypothetical protein
MSSDAKAAIAETAARAKELFEVRGGPDRFGSLFTMNVLLRKASAAEILHPQPGDIIFDWRRCTRVYRKEVGDVLLDGAEGDAFIDRVLCNAAAVILDAVGSIPDARLRSYVCGRLMGGLTPLAKRRRGQKKTSNDYRDVVIAGCLIPPLLDRFNATRNAETRHTESACSIATKALASVGVHMSEKRVENIWARFTHV